MVYVRRGEHPNDRTGEFDFNFTLPLTRADQCAMWPAGCETGDNVEGSFVTVETTMSDETTTNAAEATTGVPTVASTETFETSTANYSSDSNGTQDDGPLPAVPDSTQVEEDTCVDDPEPLPDRHTAFISNTNTGYITGFKQCFYRRRK